MLPRGHREAGDRQPGNVSRRDLPDGVVVAIPTYNRASMLDRAVRSVLAQQHEAVTVIIADNASTDGTPEVCRALAAADARVGCVHRHERNLGLTANANWLMQRALSHDRRRHGFFMFLSDDDWIEPDYIRLCVEKLREDHGHSLVVGRTHGYGEGLGSWDTPDVNLEADDPIRRVAAFCRDVVPAGTMSGVMPLDIVARLPPQRNVLGNDWLLLINIAFLGKIATLRATSVHRSADGVSSSLRDLTATLGVSSLQAAKPLLTIGLFLADECLHRSPVFVALSVRRRLHVLIVALAGFLRRRGAPLIQRRLRRSASAP